MPLDITNIKHRDLHDKLRVFQLAGEDSDKGWDYAIPQKWADELYKMGIENPGRWFAADCNAIFPKLRHIGEAVFTILHARSEANKEVISELLQDDGPNGMVNRLICDWPDNAICNEADCGLVDYNMIISLANKAYYLGAKATKEETLVNEKKDSDLIMESETAPGGRGTAPGSITLRKWGEKTEFGESQWVTHFHNHQDGGYHVGRYFFDKTAAMDNYLDRCKELGVQPF